MWCLKQPKAPLLLRHPACPALALSHARLWRWASAALASVSAWDARPLCLYVRLCVCLVCSPLWCPAALALSRPWRSALPSGKPSASPTFAHSHLLFASSRTCMSRLPTGIAISWRFNSRSSSVLTAPSVGGSGARAGSVFPSLDHYGTQPLWRCVSLMLGFALDLSRAWPLCSSELQRNYIPSEVSTPLQTYL